jgi:hypothetical protein
MQALADKRLAAITTEQGQEMSREVGAVMYREISSLQMVGVLELFMEVIELIAAQKLRAQRQGRCCMM